MNNAFYAIFFWCYFNQNSCFVEWLKSDSVKPKAFDFTHENPIGYGVPQGKKIPIYNLTESRIILLKDETQALGFKILTTFPIVE